MPNRELKYSFLLPFFNSTKTLLAFYDSQPATPGGSPNYCELHATDAWRDLVSRSFFWIVFLLRNERNKRNPQIINDDHNPGPCLLARSIQRSLRPSRCCSH
eukprot:TRINITY_DN3156_c0_g1_i1.p1 TRINITY_DN3156_c0_g1~~TRINITY_DN3156_c0_g1_i1.p1  ORF type:complete len:102 (+),score=9.44 TRINITY_DN3156_c0_g1_i1:257-562(+)